MIEIKNLTFAYGPSPPLFEDFTFQVGRGEVWSVIGPSGCGKTTLLYLLAGLRRPNRGEIIIAGTSISRPRPQSGLVLQDHGLLPWATVHENALLGLSIRKFYGPDGRHAPADKLTDKSGAEALVDYWLGRMGIDELRGKYPSQLSRGQRQRTAIARTLALSPDLLLMDEPFSALDAAIREDLQRVMMDLQHESNMTSIIVTHDIEEAAFMGKNILVLSANFNRKPCIIKNDVAGRNDYRTQPAFHSMCEELRGLLGRSE